MGLKKDDRTFAFYYPRKFTEGGIVAASWKPKLKKSVRELTRPMKFTPKPNY